MAFLTKSLFIIFLAFTCSSAYTFIVFEVEWPATNCLTKQCSKTNSGNFDGKNFNIHGLWPSGSESNDCEYPSNCTDEKLDYSLINQSDIEYIQLYWNSFYNDTENFRIHEWEKHGTCFEGSQTQYYNVVSKIHKQYNPISALAKRNIFPSNDKNYSVSFVKQALEFEFQGPVLLKCTSVKGVQMLQKIDLIFSKDLSTLIEAPCSKSLSNQCNAKKPLTIPEYYQN
ncbi:ribonuclease T2 family protein (macronuclear) [Tetrahymena thermophila SB210]|uniref:Ribonuclease T2 family protein n=1 Tax=Tetrahymena thermophila (strain SB210) TaxID=312017 RepID=I7MHK2_TETTS|nr:ribonuclease T2 family protein [Tetrahymena thermophila SB210]EAS03046.1 ribonuclease T2 family protein [Tetrahymena thermophila SB210]|eukprot:XP_001023291.1 ribonuclease T2 family protein [Tetrahymena thermophila SB210]